MSATVFYADASELATLTNTFSVAGVATDPTTVSLVVTDPTGTATTYTYALSQITKTGTGVYTKDIACSLAGTWTYEWVGTGSAADAAAGTWDVYEVALGRLYATVEALKSRMRITGTSDDYELHTACFAASRSIEQECERHFWRTTSAEVRTFVPCGYYSMALPEFNDLVSVTTFKTDSSGDGTYESTWATTDYQLLPLNPTAAPEPRPYTRIRAVGALTFPASFTVGARGDLVQITGVFGWPGVPRMIQQAALILAQDVFALKGATFGVQQFGDLTLRVGTGDRINSMVAPYRRNPLTPAGQKMFVA